LVSTRSVPGELCDLLVRRSAQVIDYQSETLAEHFLDLVETAAAVDDVTHDWALTRAVAEAWFKLLTYKDEYEVARLHLKVNYDHVARELGIEGPYSVTYHLHPPTLRRLGRKKKLALGKPYKLSFHVLRRMKRLRGTLLDLFGLDPDRRLERDLIVEYETLVGALTAPQVAVGYEDKVRLAKSAMEIKGYGEIKSRAAAAWRAEVAELAPRAEAERGQGS
jgi:indolepyruvate ferredoxin oxidoreductase